MRKKNILFLVSHPIQYFSPLFKELTSAHEINLTVLYCSNEGNEKMLDRGFDKEIKWDIPLLDGYEYKFLRNYSPKPSIFSGFFGLMNFKLFSLLRKNEYECIIIHGWNYFTHIYAAILSYLFGLRIMLRGDNIISDEMVKPIWKRLVKIILFKFIYFKICDVFLYVGAKNKEYYKYYGVTDDKLVLAPHSVENERFKNDFKRLKPKRNKLRQIEGISAHDIVILFVGKLIDKKNPLDLLRAYQNISFKKNVSLIYVGDGKLRNQLETYTQQNNIRNVHFVGFKNQTEISTYYSMSNILVLPSGVGETWGLVVNEAMNFGIPAIVSNLVGCSGDLVKNNVNGFVFEEGNIEELSICLLKLIDDNKLRKQMSSQSLNIINNFNYMNIKKGIVQGLSLNNNG